MEVSYRYFIPVKYFPEEGGHAGIRSWVHCAVLKMPIEEFQPTEIPWEIDTSHRSSSQKRWTEREREREERLRFCRREAPPKGNSAGAWHKSRLPTACGRKADCGCTYWQRIWDWDRHPPELPIENMSFRRRKHVLNYPNSCAKTKHSLYGNLFA